MEGKAMRSAAVVSLGCLLAVISANAEEIQLVEEIYVVRSLRLSRDPASPFCASERTGFQNARFEDHYKFQSIAVDTNNGMVTDANVRTVGTLHACFGPTEDPKLVNFYAEGNLGKVSLQGRGECRNPKRDYPEAGANIHRCYLDIANLPSDYVGGHLTTNTVTSKQNVGPTSDPPGYVQPSIATIRLWRKRQQN
jgi:hypothetical protein